MRFFLSEIILGLTENACGIHHRDDLSAEIDHTFDEIRGAPDGSDFGDADISRTAPDANAVRFIADPETYNV